MLVGANCLGEAVEEDLHALRIGIGQYERESVVGAGLHRAVEIGEGVALVGAARGPLAAREPAVADAALLADARLVLKDEPDALARMCICNRLQPVTQPP